MLFLIAGKYYLIDVGYPNEYGYLDPYKGGQEKVFNCVDSSLYNVIKHSFEVWK
jgi:hypothetical protein